MWTVNAKVKLCDWQRLRQHEQESAGAGGLEEDTGTYKYSKY